MSAPKLEKLLSEVTRHGTVRLHVSSDKKAGARTVEVIESLGGSARRMSLAYARCLNSAGLIALSVDDLEDMIDMSVLAHNWLQGCCAQLGLPTGWATMPFAEEDDPKFDEVPRPYGGGG